MEGLEQRLTAALQTSLTNAGISPHGEELKAIVSDLTGFFRSEVDTLELAAKAEVAKMVEDLRAEFEATLNQAKNPPAPVVTPVGGPDGGKGGATVTPAALVTQQIPEAKIQAPPGAETTAPAEQAK